MFDPHMEKDPHDEALVFVETQLREMSLNGSVLRAERSALVAYAGSAARQTAKLAVTEKRSELPPKRGAVLTATSQTAPSGEGPRRSADALPSEPKVVPARIEPLPRSAVGVGPENLRASLDALEARALACSRCESIARVRRSVVKAEGSELAEILFVGDAPSVDEDAAGSAFRGGAGELMDKMLMAMGLNRSEVYLAPAIRCRPDAPVELPRKPTDAERAACSPFLEELIGVLRPRVIVAMGAEAYRALFGREALVSRVRSVWADRGGVPVMTTFHPSHLITNPAVSVKRQVWEDLMKVLELLGHPITDKQRGYFLPKR